MKICDLCRKMTNYEFAIPCTDRIIINVSVEERRLSNDALVGSKSFTLCYKCFGFSSRAWGHSYNSHFELLQELLKR